MCRSGNNQEPVTQHYDVPVPGRFQFGIPPRGALISFGIKTPGSWVAGTKGNNQINTKEQNELKSSSFSSSFVFKVSK